MLLQVYFNTLRNWVLLDTVGCRVQPIMFSTSSSGTDAYVLTEFAQRLGWQVLQATKVSKYGVPFVKHMYMDAAKQAPNCTYYAYSNGDILYSHGLVDTLQTVSQVYIMQNIINSPC